MAKYCAMMLVVMVVGIVGISVACSSSGGSDLIISSRAYKGHENDVDINNLCRVYTAVVGTRLDDCQTCHIGEMDGDTQVTNACDNCHNLTVYGTGHTFDETLNPYGAAYMAAGRTQSALVAIKNDDSDGDGYTNNVEIAAGRYPGNKHSMPGQPVAKLITTTLTKLKTMTSHSEFMLGNANKQEFDDYATYKGVRLSVLFAALGIDTTGATGITVIAPDGFMKSFDMDEIDMVYPEGIYDAGLDVATLGTECGFVTYPAVIPNGLTDLGTIPGDQYVLIAYERDGDPMVPSYLDIVSGKIEGEGPLRLVVPQSDPGTPDRGLKYSPTNCNDGYDYDDNKDHNAGDMVRGVIAIRIDPMPDGVEEFDYTNGGWAYIDAEQLIIYGHNID